MSTPNNPKEMTMDTPTTGVKGSSHHPLMIAAALAVVLFCLVGTAAILGWLPSSIGGNAGNQTLSEADRAALAAKLQQGAPATAQPLAQPYAAQPGSAVPYPVQPPTTALAPRESHLANRPTQLAAAEPSRNWCSSCGNIESIRAVTTRARGSGLGAGAGAVLGGLLGNQIGSGHGRQLATVAGAVGGAVVGNQVEGNIKATTTYEIRVRLDDGSLRTFHQHSVPPWHTGERVRIVKGAIHAA
jgi:outer membrane lipoprotein SlyB